MTEEELQAHRGTRLKAWIEDKGGVAASLAGRPGVPPSYPSYLSQLVSGYSFGSRAARRCEALLGMPDLWLDTDVPKSQDDRIHHPGFAGQAQEVSLRTVTFDPRHLTLEELMSGPLPREFKFTITDGAMAPEFQPGSVGIFSTDAGDPKPRDAVLVGDEEGNVFFREYRFKKPGHWQAVSLADGYDQLDSIQDRLHIIAILTGRIGRRSG